MQDFKKLHVWQKAHALSLGVLRATRRIRAPEFTSLRSQMFRAAMSVPANIAEGRRQNNEKNFARFLGYALNSNSELEYHLIVARDTGAMPEREFVLLAGETITVRKMLFALLKRLQSVNATSTPPRSSARSHEPASHQPPAGRS